MAEVGRLTISKYLTTLIILFVATIITTVIGLLAGSIDISVSQLLNVILGKAGSNVSQIILEIRLPRVLLAIAAGGGLSCPGRDVPSDLFPIP